MRPQFKGVSSSFRLDPILGDMAYKQSPGELKRRQRRLARRRGYETFDEYYSQVIRAAVKRDNK